MSSSVDEPGGDRVALHSHRVRKPDDRGLAVVDIFRLENGKIVEHWDVIQEVPEKSANDIRCFSRGSGGRNQ